MGESSRTVKSRRPAGGDFANDRMGKRPDSDRRYGTSVMARRQTYYRTAFSPAADRGPSPFGDWPSRGGNTHQIGLLSSLGTVLAGPISATTCSCLYSWDTEFARPAVAIKSRLFCFYSSGSNGAQAVKKETGDRPVRFFVTAETRSKNRKFSTAPGCVCLWPVQMATRRQGAHIGRRTTTLASTFPKWPRIAFFSLKKRLVTGTGGTTGKEYRSIGELTRQPSMGRDDSNTPGHSHTPPTPTYRRQWPLLERMWAGEGTAISKAAKTS